MMWKTSCLAVVLGMVVAYVGAMPVLGQDSGIQKLVGGAESSCNYTDTDAGYCPTADGASGTCKSKYSLAKGTGDGTVESYTFCKGAVDCNTKVGSQCNNP